MPSENTTADLEYERLNMELKELADENYLLRRENEKLRACLITVEAIFGGEIIKYI